MYSYVHNKGEVLSQYHYANGEANEPDRYSYIHDRLGSTRLVIDTSKNVQNTYTYNLTTTKTYNIY